MKKLTSSKHKQNNNKTDFHELMIIRQDVFVDSDLEGSNAGQVGKAIPHPIFQAVLFFGITF